MIFRLLARVVLAGAFLAPAAAAENASSVKTGALKTAFTFCNTQTGERTCSQETWAIKILPDGWEMEATSTIDGSATQWGEHCRGGQYRYRGQEDIDWAGTCQLTGGVDGLCFHTDIKTGPTSGLNMTSLVDQCFAVLDETICAMRMNGRNIVNNADGTVDDYVATGENTTECTATEIALPN